MSNLGAIQSFLKTNCEEQNYYETFIVRYHP